MSDDTDEVLFALHKRRSERMMKFVVVILAVALLTILYILIYD